MELQIYKVNAFGEKLLEGNPAAVVLLDWPLADETMLQIAKENGLPETAFLRWDSIIQDWLLRWFTPEIEIDLCGHATLATAAVVHHIETVGRRKSGLNVGYGPQGKDSEWGIRFNSMSGQLGVSFSDGLYHLDFPSRPPQPAELPSFIEKALSIKPVEVYKARDYLLLYNSRKEIEDMEVDRAIFDSENIDPGGVVITAAGADQFHFVSRFFTPQAEILEDPVTGSAHSTLIPFWAKRLGVKKMVARQLSARGGTLYCEDRGERVQISGKAKIYLKGEFYL